MRALPADSLEYFGATAAGNAAFPVDAGEALGLAAGFAAAAAAGAGAAGEGVADASVPHSALRKSFHFMPLRVPAVCAALYLALHSFIVSALAELPIKARAVSAPKADILIRYCIFMKIPPGCLVA